MAVSRTGKLTKRISFKKNIGFKNGPNGTKIPNYKEMINPWFGYKKKYLSEVKNEDTSYKNTINIVIRQKQKEEIQPDWIGEINGKDFEILEMNPDTEDQGFMLLVLKAVE